MRTARWFAALLPMLLLSGCYLSVNDDDRGAPRRTHCSVSCPDDGHTEASCPKDQVATCTCDPKPSATCAGGGSHKAGANYYYYY